jgi:hypothetical protein
LVFDKLKSYFGGGTAPPVPPRSSETPKENVPFTINDGWRDCFAPVVRGADFRGSGQNFYRTTEAFVLVVNVQGLSAGGKFCVNLGIQPLMLPEAKLPKPKEYECAFRQRLTEGRDDLWWPYDQDRASIVAAASGAARLFGTRGIELFTQQGFADSPILHVKAAEFAEGNNRFSGFGGRNANVARILSELRYAGGEAKEARAFAQIGLEWVGPHATGLRAKLDRLAKAE